MDKILVEITQRNALIDQTKVTRIAQRGIQELPDKIIDFDSDIHGILNQEYGFNNDSIKDPKRNSFFDLVPHFAFGSKVNNVPFDYVIDTVCNYQDTQEIYMPSEKMIIVGEYFNQGLIVPKNMIIAFDGLLTCSPLISLIDDSTEQYIAFLHTFSDPDNPMETDNIVEEWMKDISNYGTIVESVFAPKIGSNVGNTGYYHAIDFVINKSNKTTVLYRDVSEIIGVTNSEGIYFENCGYYLWGN